MVREKPRLHGLLGPWGGAIANALAMDAGARPSKPSLSKRPKGLQSHPGYERGSLRLGVEPLAGLSLKGLRDGRRAAE